ncbi:MAG: prephenate dehydratase [Granulosicoccaceae bacterium]|jgi:chorismate mutase/prephenate dehydratase
MSEEQQLKAIRERIDSLDDQIQELIRQRAECALDVARVKRTSGEQVDFYRPDREAEVLRMVKQRNKGPLEDEPLMQLFREIMSACLALQQPMKIAYLGPEGTFTQAAALKHFGHGIVSEPMGAIDEVFREVEAGNAHYGVVPVENSTEGVINYTLDMFVQSPLQICGEVELRIHHNLMGQQDSVQGIKRLYSHQQSLAQCREWLDANLPGVERIAVSSNAEAARRASLEEGVAAIASDAAAGIYGLKLIAANIEDEPDNTTRFLIIGRHDSAPSGNDKTSMLVSVANKAGALYELLAPFTRNGISMTRIESRPSRRGMWDYVFFIDIEGHRQDEMVAKTISEIEAQAAMLKVLGSYPHAEL